MKIKFAGIALAFVSITTCASDYTFGVGAGALSFDVEGYMGEGFGSSFQLMKEVSGFRAGIALDHLETQVGNVVPTTLDFWSVQGVAQFDFAILGAPTYFSTGLGIFTDINRTTQYSDLTLVYGESATTTVAYSDRTIDTFFFSASIGAGLSLPLTEQASFKVEADARLLDVGTFSTSARALLVFDL